MTSSLHTHASLASLTTFRLPARARELALIRSVKELPEMLDCTRPLLLGGGSNTLFLNDYPGRVLLMRIRGIETGDAGPGHVRVTVGAGENWHGLVRWSIRQGLHGLENLALIPGLAGAAPMQNIGAYGAQLSDCLEAVEAWDRKHGQRRWLERAECELGYRTSRFRTTEPDRFVVTRIRLLLEREFRPRTDYETLRNELARTGVKSPRAPQVAAAVMRVRRHRLPDPKRIANAGSFFKNPVIDKATAGQLAEEFSGLPCWPAGENRVKVSAAWMIDRLGWKGRRMDDAGVYANHALVLVNHGRASARSLVGLAEAIQSSVKDAFGIRLEPEPRLVGLPPGSGLAT